MPLRGNRTALDAAGPLCKCRAHVCVMLCKADQLPREAMDYLGPDHTQPSENPSAGEGQKEKMDGMLAAALQYFEERGELDGSPVLVALEHVKPGPRLSKSPVPS